MTETKTKTEKIFLALMPGAIHLFFKFRKSKLLAEAPWELDLTDKLIVEPRERANIPRRGVIRLFRASQRIRNWYFGSPFAAGYFDGKKYHLLLMDETHWQLPAFQPFKTEYDVWKAESEASERRKNETQQSKLAAQTQSESKPAVAPTITISVKPKS